MPVRFAEVTSSSMLDERFCCRGFVYRDSTVALIGFTRLTHSAVF